MKLKGILPGLVKADGVCQDILAGEKIYSGTLIPESVMDGQPIDYAKVRFKLNARVIWLVNPSSAI